MSYQIGGSFHIIPKDFAIRAKIVQYIINNTKAINNCINGCSLCASNFRQNSLNTIQLIKKVNNAMIENKIFFMYFYPH